MMLMILFYSLFLIKLIYSLNISINLIINAPKYFVESKMHMWIYILLTEQIH